MAVWYSGVTVALLVQRWPVPMLQVRDWREQHAPPQRFAESIARLLDQPRYLSRESSQILQNLIPPRHSQHLSSWRSGKVPLPPSSESGAQVIAAIRLSTLNKSWYWPLRKIRPRHATIHKRAGQFKRRGYSGAPACVYLHGMVFLALNIAKKNKSPREQTFMQCTAMPPFLIRSLFRSSHDLLITFGIAVNSQWFWGTSSFALAFTVPIQKNFRISLPTQPESKNAARFRHQDTSKRTSPYNSQAPDQVSNSLSPRIYS